MCSFRVSSKSWMFIMARSVASYTRVVNLDFQPLEMLGHPTQTGRIAEPDYCARVCLYVVTDAESDG